MTAAVNNDTVLDVDVICNKYDTNTFRSTFNIVDKFIVFHQNVRSFQKNGDEFILFLTSLDSQFDVIILSETWFSDGYEQHISGFRSYHTCRSDRRGGGVSVYVSEKLKSYIIPDLSFTNSIAEFCTVNVTLSLNENINIIGFYRPPGNANVADFCDLLRDSVLSKFSPSQSIVASGDANIDLLSVHDSSTCQYMNIVYSFSLIPCITLPTRVTEYSSTLIDHFWCNIVSNVKSGIIETDITDHFTVFLCIFDRRSDSSLLRRNFRDCSEESLARLETRLAESLSGFDLYDSLDVNIRTKIFMNIFWNTYEECCPVKTKFISRTRLNKPWFDSDLRRLCDEKHKLFKRYKENLIPFSEYNTFKNRFSSLLKRTKINYFKTQFYNCKADIKST